MPTLTGVLRRPTRARLGVGGTALLVEVAAFAVVVGGSGSPAGRLLRVVLVLALGAAALAVEFRGGPFARGFTTLAVAVPALTTGAGLGVLHLAKGDPTPAALAAIVLLAVGLVQVALGVRRLWSATPRWWRLLAVPLTFLTVEFVLIPVSAAVYATNVPATPLDGRTPADLGLAYSDVTLAASDGVRLSAWYVPSRNGAAVVALHGAGSNRTGVLDQAAVVARHGYGVLLLDARGHGRSSGTAMDNGWWGDQDVAAAVGWLQARPDVRPTRIGLLGLSMGGEEAIGAAAGNRAVRAVVAEGALWRGSMDAGWLPRTPSGYVERGMLAIQTAVSAVLTAAPRPPALTTALARIAPRPVLLVAGRPELRGDRYLRDHAGRNVELWTLPDTPHTGGLSHHRAEWERRVVGFLDRALAAAA